MDRYDAIIVGAGHNGLVAGFYLARAGRKVLLCERRGFVGGACATEEIFDGYRISTCAYVMWKLERKVRDDMALDARGLKMHLIDPPVFFPYEDGSHAFLHSDMERTMASIAQLNRRDAERYPDWVAQWARMTGLVQPTMLAADPPSLSDIRERAKASGDTALLEKFLTSSLVDLTAEFFADERVRAMMVYVQDMADPYAPGGAWAETFFQFGAAGGHGFYVVEGGMGQITAKMAEAVIEQGGDIRCDAPVARVLVEDGAACGVRLESGEEIRSRLVLSNADPKRTYRTLFEPTDLPDGLARQVERFKTETGYFKFHCVMDKAPDVSGYLRKSEIAAADVSYILIAPSLDHYARAGAEMRAGQPCSEPICHLQIPTIYDSTLTEKDGVICSIWGLYAPPRLAEGSWPERRDAVGEGVIDYVTRFIPNFRADIREWMFMSPWDIEQRTGITDGAIRHLDVVPSQFLGGRPSCATPIGNFYLCGGGIHPAGEVTGAPGHNAAHYILRTTG
jgi:phytoene dehydrogenase-like protein